MSVATATAECSLPVTDSPTGPSGSDWLSAVLAALADVEQAARAAVGYVENGKVFPAAGNLGFWSACVALTHALARRPVAAKFAAASEVAAGLAENLIRVFQPEDAFRNPRITPISATPPTVAVINSLDALRERLAGVDAPKRPKETPMQCLAMPHMADSQLLKMFPHLSRPQVWAARDDSVKNPLPPAPPETPPAPITTISSRLSKLLDQLTTLAAAVAAAETEQPAEPAKTAKPCPESPHQLWQQKVSIPQSAKMLSMSVAEVTTMFNQFDDDYDADLLCGRVVTPLVQVIREMHRSGKPIKVIANELKIDPSIASAAIQSQQLQPV